MLTPGRIPRSAGARVHYNPLDFPRDTPAYVAPAPVGKFILFMGPISSRYSRERTAGPEGDAVEISPWGRRLRSRCPLLVVVMLAGGALGQPSARSLAVRKLVDAAVERTTHQVRYDGRYVRIAYPGGDVPADSGVCTDEIVRIYRAVGIDLQKEVHEDIVAHPWAYPARGSARRRQPDANIDHRRVPNLMVFFSRKGQALAKSLNPADYAPGDIATWDLGGGVNHIGMVVDQRGPSGSYMVVHNIGQGPQMEDVLFNWRITGHYRYYGSGVSAAPVGR